MNKSRVHSLKD